MKVSELFAEIGFRVDTAGLKEFSKTMQEVKTSIKSCFVELNKLKLASKKIKASVVIEKQTTSIKKDEKEGTSIFSIFIGSFLSRLVSGIERSILKGFKKAVFAIARGSFGFIRDTIRSAMVYRDYRTFTGRSAKELTELMSRSLNTTSLTPQDVLQSAMGFEKGFWDIFLGKKSPAPFHMLGLMPTGHGATDLTNILNKIAEIEQSGLRASMLEMAGLEPGKWMQIVEDIRSGKSWEEVYSLAEEEINRLEGANNSLRTFMEQLEQVKIKIIDVLLQSGFSDMLKEIVESLRNLLAVMRSDEYKKASLTEKAEMLANPDKFLIYKKYGWKDDKPSELLTGALGFLSGALGWAGVIGSVGHGNFFGATGSALLGAQLADMAGDRGWEQNRENNQKQINIIVRDKNEAIDIGSGLMRDDPQADYNWTNYSVDAMSPTD